MCSRHSIKVVVGILMNMQGQVDENAGCIEGDPETNHREVQDGGLVGSRNQDPELLEPPELAETLRRVPGGNEGRGDSV
jgi:hypothetical protein